MQLIPFYVAYVLQRKSPRLKTKLKEEKASAKKGRGKEGKRGGMEQAVKEKEKKSSKKSQGSTDLEVPTCPICFDELDPSNPDEKVCVSATSLLPVARSTCTLVLLLFAAASGCTPIEMSQPLFPPRLHRDEWEDEQV